ncbi:MAG: DNA-binding response regulator [Spirochaetaceae bacterium]|nr:MAG: DNA-binding response regulator [Spirochaetaceae bacterium]
MATDVTTLMIVDDHALFVEGLRYIIESLAPDMRVIGTAADAGAALDLARTTRPNIVLMDVRMPGVDGVEGARLFQRELPDVKVIMLTTFDDDEYVHQALQYGAYGYLMKSLRPKDLVLSIRSVVAGNVLVDGTIRSHLMATEPQMRENDVIVRGLVRRERQVLRLVVASRSNSQICEELNLSDHSVRNYVSALYAAFDVKDRFELIQKLSRTTIPLD